MLAIVLNITLTAADILDKLNFNPT